MACVIQHVMCRTADMTLTHATLLPSPKTLTFQVVIPAYALDIMWGTGTARKHVTVKNVATMVETANYCQVQC